jgi:WD40 repeat protein
VLDASVASLARVDQPHLADLSIFPEDIPIPLNAAAALWRLDDLDTGDLAQQMARLCLLKLDLAEGTLRLHDVMRKWLASRVAEPASAHSRLVDAWPDWRSLPTGYAWRWLPWHLAKAGRDADLSRILWDPAWMLAKLKATDINALIGDYELLPGDLDAGLVQGALRLSANVLAWDSGQFASHLVGRLLPYRDSPAIGRFVDRTSAAARKPWLRPLHPALRPPGTGLLRTLKGHSAGVNGVAVTADGRRAVSASPDTTLKVWDVETGRTLLRLEGHSAAVSGVAVTADGKRAVSASRDKTLKVWIWRRASRC